MTFHLGNAWRPGKLTADKRVAVDTSATNNDVRIVLPKINLVIEQGLEEGEVVIVEGVQKIRPGVPVSPVFRDGGAQDS